IAAAACSRASASRPSRTTSQPSRARSRARARPSPRDPPVMIASAMGRTVRPQASLRSRGSCPRCRGASAATVGLSPPARHPRATWSPAPERLTVAAVIRDLLRPWRQVATWWALTHVLLDVYVGALTFSVVLTLLVTTASLLFVFPVAIPLAWLLFVSARVLGHFERARYAALLDVHLVDPVPPLRERGWWRRLGERVR